MPAEVAVDLLNDPLKEIVYRRKHKALFRKLVRETHFNFREVEALALIHRKITLTRGPMNRLVFRDILHSGFDFTENIRHVLVDRIFPIFDKQNALQIHLDGWIEGLSVILRGTLDERIHFAYRVYDFMRTNRLKKEQIFPSMRGCMISMQTDENPGDAVKDLIELMMKKMDVDRDGAISEDDFRTAVKEKNVLFLECMGPVFPSRTACHTFLTTFTENVGRF